MKMETEKNDQMELGKVNVISGPCCSSSSSHKPFCKHKDTNGNEAQIQDGDLLMVCKAVVIDR